MSFIHPDNMHSAFASAFTRGDIDGLLALHESGAVQVQQDGSHLTGPDALRTVFTALVSAGVTMQSEQRLAVVADDIALTSTRYEMPITGEDGATLSVVTAEVSRLQPDGSWRLVIDVPSFA